MNVDILEKKIKDTIDMCRQIDFLKETQISNFKDLYTKIVFNIKDYNILSVISLN